MPPLRDVLEAALVANPDDVAAHMAYADYLQEHGDPRGEFIQVQLALEETDKTADERRRLQQRENELLAEHGSEWLGVLADELLGPQDAPWESRPQEERPYEIRFARGWLDRIVRRAIFERIPGLPRLSQAPECRLLRELVLEEDDETVETSATGPSFLGNLRVLQLGVQVDDFGDFRGYFYSRAVPDFVARLPCIEELYLLAKNYDLNRLFDLRNLQNLRVLQVYHVEAPYPLEILAANPTLGRLTHLLLHPHGSAEPFIDLAGVRAILESPHLHAITHLQVRCADLGDVGCTEIVTSGVLKRLKILDLRHGEITDAGARTLADCADLRNLERLDIDRNGLTQTGIDALRRVLGPALRADDQQTPEELAQRQYLYEGDFE